MSVPIKIALESLRDVSTALHLPIGSPEEIKRIDSLLLVGVAKAVHKEYNNIIDILGDAYQDIVDPIDFIYKDIIDDLLPPFGFYNPEHPTAYTFEDILDRIPDGEVKEKIREHSLRIEYYNSLVEHLCR